MLSSEPSPSPRLSIRSSLSLLVSLVPNLAHAVNPVHSTSFALTNVRLFDGWTLHSAVDNTVLVRDGLIASINPPSLSSSTPIIDGNATILLPGFIDGHVHIIDSPTDLIFMRSQGITTALDMACFLGKDGCDGLDLASAERASPPQSATGSHEIAAHAANLTALAPYPSIFFSYVPAVAPISSHASIVPKAHHVGNPDEARGHVKVRVSEGANHVKIINTTPGFDAATLAALTEAARKAGKPTICHATDIASFMASVAAGCSQLHHVPTDKVLSADQVHAIREGGQIVVPTLIQMQEVIHARNSMLIIRIMGLWACIKQLVHLQRPVLARPTYSTPRENVRLLAAAGVPILVGTDATGKEGPVIFNVHMGTGFQKEMRLLAEAGVSNVGILRGMTGLAAREFGLIGRGEIKAGMRADLVLVDGKPEDDIGDLQNVRKVWIGGIEGMLQTENAIGGEIKGEL